MTIVFGLAIYFMIWWIVLFAALPFGLRQTQEESGEVIPGTEPSAPDRPRFLKVIILTTVVATCLFAGYVALRNSGIGLDDLPFPGPRAHSPS